MEPKEKGDLEKTVSEIEEIVDNTVNAHMIAERRSEVHFLSSGVD